VVDEKTSTLRFDTENSSKWLANIYKPPNVADSVPHRDEYQEYFLEVKKVGVLG